LREIEGYSSDGGDSSIMLYDAVPIGKVTDVLGDLNASTVVLISP